MSQVLEGLNASEVRARIRAGQWRRPTAGLAPGWAQANLVVVPEAFATDFQEFCELNPRPCPLLDVTEPGSSEPRHAAPGADLRTDMPRYRVYRDGRLAEETDSLLSLWQSNFVAFLLGCSFTFEAALGRAGIPLRHIELGCNVAMYRTNRPCATVGPFQGPMVVSMRPVAVDRVPDVVQITSHFDRAHGGPIHVGDPQVLGIADLGRPDYGDPLPVRDGETPVFWACGVTPQAAAVAAQLPLLISHAPGYMFITDLRDEDLASR